MTLCKHLRMYVLVPKSYGSSMASIYIIGGRRIVIIPGVLIDVMVIPQIITQRLNFRSLKSLAQLSCRPKARH
jgi:hypothetical protein